MFYLGIFFLLIGIWQSYENGYLSPAIGGMSLILGTSFIFIGSWHIGLFFVFMFITWILLMQIFVFSTYHRYFLKIAPLLISYAFLIIFLLKQFNFQNLFWWYFSLSSIYLFNNYTRQLKDRTIPIILDSIPEGEGKECAKKELLLSSNRTIKYHSLSSLVFISALLLAFSIL